MHIPGESVGCQGTGCKGAELSRHCAGGIKNENEKD